MEKRIYLNDRPTPFWIEDTGRLRNEKTKRWLKGGINKGYHYYSLFFAGKQYIKYTHRLVAEYFLDNPENKEIVHHKDGNRLNNIYTNLEWATQKELTDYSSKKPSEHKKINIEDLPEMAQFRNSPYYATKDGRIINVSKNIEMKLEHSGNYLRFTGRYNLNNKHFLVHRVVWEAFNGPIEDGYDIDHIDGNPHNNHLDNLEKVTHAENIKRRKIDFSYAANNFPPR